MNKKTFEPQIPDVLPEEDRIFVRDKNGNFVEVEVPDDESDD